MNRLTGRDVAVAVALHVLREASSPNTEAAWALGLAAPRVSESIRRLVANKVYLRSRRTIVPVRLRDLLLDGVPWLFPIAPGEVARGVPTAHAGPVLREQLVFDQAYVWPSVEDDDAEGLSIEPLHPGVARTVRTLPAAYELLSLADAMRVGRARERNLAAVALRERLADRRPAFAMGV